MRTDRPHISHITFAALFGLAFVVSFVAGLPAAAFRLIRRALTGRR